MACHIMSSHVIIYIIVVLVHNDMSYYDTVKIFYYY